jgi:hypothetical protein
MIDVVICTKNRAMQLDLLLRSLKLNWPELEPSDILVFYDFDESHKMSYVEISKIHNDVNFISQNGQFKRNLKYLVHNILKNDEILFLCDDDVMINKMTELYFAPSNDDYNKDLKCVSLRLTSKINYSFAHNRAIDVPPICYHSFGWYSWDWTKVKDKKSDWAYPHNLAGHIYPRKYFLQMIRWSSIMGIKVNRYGKVWFANWNGFNSLESAMSRWPRKETPRMAFYKEQILFNPAVNCVQTEYEGNRVGVDKYQTVEALNRLFLQGYRIKLEPFLGMVNNQLSSDEVIFEFER